MQHALCLFGALFLFSAAPLSSQNTFYFPPLTGNTWETIDPASIDFCPERIDSLYRFLEEKNSKSFLLLQDGKIVLEKYFGTFTRDSFWYWASAGKSLTAFLVGQAQEAGMLAIDAPTSTYLGTGWTSCPPEKENLISVRNQLSMTSGLNDAVPDDNCSTPSCLTYLADAGTRWAYHNAPYRLLHDVIAAASGQTINQFTKTNVLDRTGMKGLWIDHIMYGRARDMARFGLLTLAGGVWNGDTLLHDTGYLYDMAHPSQTLNNSYGYLWWLNGQSNFMLPGVQFVFPGYICPNAPADMYAALGKNDQKIHVVPSKGWVVVRQGEAGYTGPGGGNVPIILDNVLWDYLNKLVCASSPVTNLETADPVCRIWPNPAENAWMLSSSEAIDHVEIYSTDGRLLRIVTGGQNMQVRIEAADLAPGWYLLRVYAGGGIRIVRALRGGVD